MITPKISGIYKITNLITQDFYIGSSIDITKRKYVHFYRFRKVVGNSIMKNAFIKYGPENFKFEIVEKVSDISELQVREQYYCDTLKPKYNIRKIVNSNRGIKVTDPIRLQKLRDSLNLAREVLKTIPSPRLRTTNGLEGSTANRCMTRKKKVLVYDLQMNLIDEVQGVRETCRKYKTYGVTDCCTGRIRKSKGYIFRYAE